MARTCSVCGFNFDKHGNPGSDRHRCLGGRMAGARKPTPLEAEQIAKGLLDPSILLPKPSAATQPAGRLAPRRPTDAPPAQTRQPDAVRPDAKSQPSNAAI